MKNKLLASFRKIISCAFALSIIVSSFGFASVAKAVVAMPTLTIGSQSALNGASITVPISASNFANSIAGMTFSVQYDASLLTYTGYTQNAISGHGTLAISDTATNPNPIVINWFDATALSVDSGAIITLNFTVISASITTADLTFVGTKELSDASDVVSSTFVPGAISLNLSSNATITSATYTISTGGTVSETITNVPFGTSKATFLAALTKGQASQTWNDTGINNPVVTGNTLVVTAQDGVTAVVYTVNVNAVLDTTPPTISLFYPADNATNVSVNVQPTLTFSEAIDTSTMNGENIELREYATLSADAKKVPTALTYSVGNKVTFILSSPLKYNKQYYFFVGTGVKDIAGNSFAAETWYHAQRASHEFTTEAVLLSSIAITHSADRLSYFVDDTLDTTGLEVTGTYSDGSTKIETITTGNVSGFNSSVPIIGQILTITVDGKTTTYTINIVAPLSSNKAITSFSFPEGSGTINESAHTIAVNVPFGTNVTALTPTITITGASVNPASGVAQNFSSPIIYTVTAENSSTQEYIVTVTIAANPAKDITSFSFPEGNGIITGTNIAVTVPYGTIVTALIPSISLSGGTISPLSGIAQNFTNPVTYIVTAADASTKEYIVTVTIAPNTEANILSFNSTTPTATGFISGNNITLTVPFGTSLVNLPIAISISPGASINPIAGNTTFVDGVATTYTVTAQDNVTTQNYLVTVTVAANSAKNITSFNFEGLTPIITGIISGTNITLNVPYGTNITTLIPTIGITGASINPASGIAQDFTSPVTYIVTAADTTTQSYTVTVIVAEPSDLTALTAAITTAQNKYNVAVEGNATGQYPAPLKANLLIAINNASAITNTSSQSIVDAAVITLNSAIATFEAGVVPPDTTKPVITLSGMGIMDIYVGSTYIDAGATASDNIDGNITANIVRVNPVNTAISGTYIITYNVSDLAGNNAIEVTRTINVLSIPSTAQLIGENITVSTSTPEIVVGDNNTSNAIITIPDNVNNATINLAALTTTTATSTTATVQGDITINASTTIGAVNVEIPSGTQIVANTTTWNGIINVPQIQANSTVTVTPESGNTASVSSVIEIGFGDTLLTFNKAVRIKIAGQAGKYVGYSRNGVFTQITNVCSSDSQAVGDALAEGAECKINVGSDLIIWTKHFTKFATYTQTATTTSGGGGGGGGGSSTPAVTIIKGDINKDGKVDKYDFALMMANWGKVGANNSDLNSDSKVDKYDFALLMVKWGAK